MKRFKSKLSKWLMTAGLATVLAVCTPAVMVRAEEPLTNPPALHTSDQESDQQPMVLSLGAENIFDYPAEAFKKSFTFTSNEDALYDVDVKMPDGIYDIKLEWKLIGDTSTSGTTRNSQGSPYEDYFVNCLWNEPIPAGATLKVDMEFTPIEPVAGTATVRVRKTPSMTGTSLSLNEVQGFSIDHYFVFTTPENGDYVVNYDVTGGADTGRAYENYGSISYSTELEPVQRTCSEILRLEKGRTLLISFYFNGGEEAIEGTFSIIKHKHTLAFHKGTPATCTDFGKKAYWECTDCGNCYLEENCTTLVDPNDPRDMDIDPKHTLIHVKAAAPTYDKAGNIEHWYCTVCGDHYKDKDAHTWIDSAEIPALEKTDISEAAIKLSGNVVYNGKVQKPSIKVTYKGSTLKEGTDYTVSYPSADYKNAGTKKVIVKGKGAFKGSLSDTYRILQKPITISGLKIKSKVYDRKKEVTLDSKNAKASGLITGDKVVVKVKSIRIFASKADAGTSKVTISKRKFTLSGASASNYYIKSAIKLTATITKNTIKTAELKKAKVKANKKSQKPVIKKVKGQNGITLTAKDYTVTYKRNGKVTKDFKSPGTITVTIKGKNSFKGSKSLRYTIT